MAWYPTKKYPHTAYTINNEIICLKKTIKIELKPIGYLPNSNLKYLNFQIQDSLILGFAFNTENDDHWLIINFVLDF